MPYVSANRREQLTTGEYSNYDIKVGDLNYMFTRVLNKWLNEVGVNYTNINSAIGVLECAKLELYRRVAVSYEDQKCYENGDVYTCLEDSQ